MKKGEAAMKNKKGYMISLFVIACILVNYIGKIIAANLELPLWLDSIGTVFSAYALGPICGAIVGVTTNIIYGIWHSFDYISYSAVSIAIGVVVGICAEKGYIQHMFGILSTGFLVTLCAVFISVPMNFLFFQGDIGNVWGDGVAKLFKELGFHKVLCSLIGQYYIDFLDKVDIISESNYSKISKGMEVDIVADAFPGETFKGKVNLIYPTIDPRSHTFPVEITVDNKDEKLRPGMFARVTVNYGTNFRVVVPDNAVLKQVGADDKYVYVVNEDNTVTYTPVKLGVRMGDKYEIISGLDDGATIVTTGQTRLKNNIKVDIVK